MPLDAAKLPSSARALLLALPDNPAADRARFREELAGGMYSLPKRRQFLVALSFWRGSGALQRALYLGGDREFLVPRRDWRCRLRMHHMVRVHDQRYPTPTTWSVPGAASSSTLPTTRRRASSPNTWILPKHRRSALHQGVSEVARWPPSVHPVRLTYRPSR